MRRSLLAVLSILLAAAPAAGQGMPELLIQRADGTEQRVRIAVDRGFAAVDLGAMEQLGWSVASVDGSIALSLQPGIGVSMRLGSPFFRWQQQALQFLDVPYREGSTTYLPLQLLTDFLPSRLPDRYSFDGPAGTLRAGDFRRTPEAGRTSSAGPGSDNGADRVGGTDVDRPDPDERPTARSAGAVPPEDGGPREVRGQDPGPGPPPDMTRPSPYDGVRVVVIDAGHGGADPGALGPDGIREKSVALGIALELKALLEERPDIEVRMTRDDDTFVDIWERGEVATDMKGERPGVFVSIHANSFTTRRSTRGFETYFLSEARTEHERRVAAIENAPLSFQADGVDPVSEADLDFILRELRNLDHSHWSALLAEMVQEELDDFHPGPNRGVKQGVLAVLTNALMPSVLVEVGYLSNREEARLLARGDFHQLAAVALSEAIVRFFERYPPGGAVGEGTGG